MLYSIQNATGKVYGIFPMPDTGQSAEVWASELSVELHGILGINGVVDSPLPRSDGNGGYFKEDRVVIDIDPYAGNEAERVRQVHEAIFRLATDPRIPS